MLLCCVIVSQAALAGCARDPVLVQGIAVSMRFDPNRVAGLPASDGPSGAKVTAPPVAGRVRGSDDGQIDRVALLAVDDITDFWQQHYSPSLPGTFSAVSSLVSIDPDSAQPPGVCGITPADVAFNALYCRPEDTIVWDRVGMLPAALSYFGEMAVNGLLAHEYGHALQAKAGLTDASTPTLVSEQQADCFAGVYLRWVAEGNSTRFDINTTEALDKVLAGAIAIRDRPTGDFMDEPNSHGSALDRVGAFQQGFDVGTESCEAIDIADVITRRGNLPAPLFDLSNRPSNAAITLESLNSLVTALNRVFTPESPPELSTSPECGPGPTSYCPGTNSVYVDLTGLQEIGTPASEGERVLLRGDNSAMSAVTSRYLLGVQRQRGLEIRGDTAAMRTACLTGVAQSRLAVRGAAGELVLGAGDVDEAVSGLLTNGIVASDISGTKVASGFTRILAYRWGLAGDADVCYRQFP